VHDVAGERLRENAYIRAYRKDQDAVVQLCEHGRRPYLQYDCPFLGFRELVFPVSFENQVVGVFFVGQICLRGRLAFSARKQREFSEANPNCFDAYCNEKRDHTPEDIFAQISQEYEEWAADPSHLIDQSSYANFISKCCSQLDGLEETLSQQMQLQRAQYIRVHIDQRVQEFRELLARRGASGSTSPPLLWETTAKVLNNLLIDFGMQYMLVFASKNLENATDSLLEVVIACGTLPDELSRCVQSGSIAFALDKLPERVHTAWATSLDEPRLFDAIRGWPSGLNHDSMLLRIFPVPLFKQASLAVLNGYPQWNPISSSENRIGGELDTAIQSFYTVVLSAASSVFAAAAEEEMARQLEAHSKALLCITHSIHRPLINVIAGATYLEETYRDKLGEMPKTWLSYVRQTAEEAQIIAGGTARVFRALLTGVHLEWGVRDVVDPVEETRRIAERMNLLEMGHPSNNPKGLRVRYENRIGTSKMYTDRQAFLFVMYNLLDNAIKYSYKKQFIDVSYEREGEDLCLKVKSYGAPIPIRAGQEYLPFELFWRGEEQPEYGDKGAIYHPGLGVGLWLSRQLARSAGGDIRLLPCDRQDSHVTVFSVTFPLVTDKYKHGE
jgi:signal transduction histidine kinase